MAYHSERDAPHWKVAGIAELRDGDKGTELDPLIADPSYDFVLQKGAPSIFFNTPAASYFAKNRVDTMIVTGCITSGCVRASVVDSFSLGFRTIVPEDCVGDHDDEPHQDNLRDVERRYADISVCDRVIRDIEVWRGRNIATWE
jgi:maleamate amidohydrolase